MSQLLAHLIGDYVLQNHWMAANKTKSSIPALIHVLLYGLPFLFLVSEVWQWFVIVGTHFVIDRWRLASYWVDFWGHGKMGWLPKQINKIHFTLSGGHSTDTESEGPSALLWPVPDAPPFLGIWLLIIVDNTMHLTINYLVLR